MTIGWEVVQGPGATAAAVANRVLIGTLSVPTNVTMIRRVWIHTAMVGTYAVNKPMSGYVQIESKHAKIEPCELPVEPMGPYLSLAGGTYQAPATKWVINCPIVGGGTLSFYSVQDNAPNAAPEHVITVEYSEGESYEGDGQQYHYSCGEPAVALSTSDNGTAALTDISEFMSRIKGVILWNVYTTALADAAVIAEVDITCTNFDSALPLNIGIEPMQGGDANAVSTNTNLTKVACDRGFRQSGKQTVSGTITIRDACSSAPDANWCIMYVE